MNTKNLKNVLEVIRALVKKNRVAYKDYLGEETVTKVLAEAVCGNEEGNMTVKDPDWTDFVAGQTYMVTIDGEASEWVAMHLYDAVGFGPYFEYVAKNNAPPDDLTGMWCIGQARDKNGKKVCIYGVLDESYCGKKFVVSQTVTQKKYDVKKLPVELLPDSVMMKVHTHANKDLLDSLTEDDLDYWYNKSNFSGYYADLMGKPTLFSGKYDDLTGKPTLFSGSYNDLTGKPDLSAYATKAYVDNLIANLQKSE